MSARLCAAIAFAAMTFAGGPKSLAADLYGENYYPPQDAEPYDDPRYAEGDRYPPPRGPYEEGPAQYDRGNDDAGPNHGDRYVDRDGPYRDDYPYRGSLKDGYVPPPPRYTDRGPAPYGNCLARWQVRSRLRGDGWVDLQPLDRNGDTTVLRARRIDSGRVFTLRVDRCSGVVVDARPHFLRAYGAYAPPLLEARLRTAPPLCPGRLTPDGARVVLRGRRHWDSRRHRGACECSWLHWRKILCLEAPLSASLQAMTARS